MTPGSQILICVFIAAVLVVVSQGPRFTPESSPAARGMEDAYQYGCIDCHGQPESNVVDDASLTCATASRDRSHVPFRGQCGDLLAYFEIVRLKRTFERRAASKIDNKLLAGERLARQYNCFLCHGELGQGGFNNEGALKGYIPGYFGNDFALLTQDGNTRSVESWIRNGVDHELFAAPIEGRLARYFIDRQDISMPIFGSLPDPTIQVLVEYVIALNQLGPMDAEAIRAYAQRTQDNE